MTAAQNCGIMLTTWEFVYCFHGISNRTTNASWNQQMRKHSCIEFSLHDTDVLTRNFNFISRPISVIQRAWINLYAFIKKITNQPSITVALQPIVNPSMHQYPLCIVKSNVCTESLNSWDCKNHVVIHVHVTCVAGCAISKTSTY